MRSLHLHQRRPAAYSLLEVVLASSICAAALVPALAILRDGMSAAERIDSRHLMLIFGIGKMEEQMAVVAASWATATLSGDFAAEGHANIRYTLSRTDAPASGGITDRLMNLAVTVYVDDNGNDTLDAEEMRTTLTTKVSKLVTYEGLAGS
jgi:hypothetical protein